jgi:DNA-binding MarR family transcriptional regulator
LNIESLSNQSTNSLHDLALLEEIERDPDVNQADLATELGVAVGTVNWHLKRLIAKGAVKVARASRRKLRYIITPEGIALRAGLTVDFVQQSFKLYRVIRTRTVELVPQIQAAGYTHVRLCAEGDARDVIRLTLMEAGIQIREDGSVPIISMVGLKVLLQMPDRKEP